jgi:hypothetical protein
MVVCFLCKVELADLRALRVHFTFYHSNNSFEQYKCAEIGCFRSYHTFNSYRKHYIREHSCTNSNVGVDQEPASYSAIESFSAVVDQLPESTVGELVVAAHEEPVVTPEEQVSLSSTDIETALASMIAVLYGSANLPRNIVQLIVESFQSIIANSLIPLIGNCLQSMVNNGNIVCHDSIFDLLAIINIRIAAGFNNLLTENRRFNFFQGRHTYIPPKTIVVGETVTQKTIRGRQTVLSVANTVQFIPLRDVLQAFFSLQSVLIDTLNHMEELYRDVNLIQNFIQGTYWQSKRRVHGSKKVIPLFLFFDDYEAGNPLGSHSGIHKLGAVYISVPCLPSWRCSVLSNIFLTLLFHSSDRSQFGNRVVFQPVINELNYLASEGIQFNVPGYHGLIYFELALIIGDNLGIHSITGFLECFSANYSCRICRVHKENMKVQTYEDETLLRNQVNYDADLLENIPSNSGVKERCVWLNIKGFNLFQQIGVDVMHDILEGVGKYVMGLVLVKFINRFAYFSLDFLNNRLISLAYGPDAHSKPVPLTIANLNKRNIRLSASEMLVFIRYFGILVGEKVPNGDSYWLLYLKLREVIELAMATSVWQGLDSVLQDSVTVLNEMYLLLSNDSLKPKFHFLVHYHRAMINFGPLSLFTAMRYEAKHKLSKTSAKASSNRKNIALSLAIKHQLKLNEMFSKGSLDPILTWGSKKLTSLSSDFSLMDFFLSSWDKTKTIFRVLWASMSSCRYSKDSILVYDKMPISDRNEVTFLMVNNVYIYNDEKIILTGNLLKSVLFDEHYYAYDVIRTDQQVAIWLTNLSFMTPHTKNVLTSTCKKNYVTLRSPI